VAYEVNALGMYQGVMSVTPWLVHSREWS